MQDAATLWLYFVMVFVVIALPGMDMAYVSASTVLGGQRAGVAAIIGIVVGGFCHVAMGALGIAALLTFWPPLFRLIALVGATYLGWIGVSLARVKAGSLTLSARSGTMSQDGAPSNSVVFRRAVVTCLLNPKAYLFMFAVFPQFLRPQLGSLWSQALALFVIGAISQIGVYGTVAWLASRAADWVGMRPRVAVWFCRAVGVLFIVAALFMVREAWLTDVITAYAR